MTLTKFERHVLETCRRPMETLELIQFIDYPTPELLTKTMNSLRDRALLDVVYITTDLLTEWEHDGFLVYRTSEKGRRMLREGIHTEES